MCLHSNQVGIVYLITLKTTDEKYVGQTTQTLEQRWKGHKNQGILAELIKKHGEENFDRKIIEEIKDRKGEDDNFETTIRKLLSREVFWIISYNTSKNGFNNHSEGCVDEDQITTYLSWIQNKKPFLCPECKWRFPKEHLIEPIECNLFVCKWNCGEEFETEKERKAHHDTIHPGNYPCYMPGCSSHFIRLHLRNKHLNQIHNKIPSKKEKKKI